MKKFREFLDEYEKKYKNCTKIIKEVKYEENQTIVEIKYYYDCDKDKNYYTKTKEAVLNDLIKNNAIYKTEDDKGNRTDVSPVSGKYIRADKNNTKEDNLGELPEF